MKARMLERADVLKIVDLLRQQGYEVIAPFSGRGRDTCFDTVTDENRDRIQMHLPNPYYPPKRFVLPHIERLLKVRRQQRRHSASSRPTRSPSAPSSASAPATWPASSTWTASTSGATSATSTTRSAGRTCSW